MLTDANRHDIHIVGCLGISGEKDYPTSIQRHHDIRVIPPDVQRTTDRAGSNVEYHGKAGTRLYRQLLHGVEKTIGTGGIEYTATSDGSAVANTSSPVFPICRDHPDLVFPLCIHFVQFLSDFSRGCYGVVAHDVVVYLFCGDGHHLIALPKVCNLCGRFVFNLF